jgi:single-stranded-DNA-specific exonuclease
VRAAIDELTARLLSEQLKLDVRAARLLVARGIRQPEDALRFLEPRLSELPDPSTMLGLDRAAERLARAIKAKERIALYGDYDVDGVTSTSLLASFLKSLGLEARVYIPKRLTEGYGLNPGAIETLAAEKTQLLITLDCGITASDEIARGNTHGIDTIVVDHHRCPAELPPAYAALNPHQPGCGYPDKGLAAVGVCFNLITGVRRVLRSQGFFAPQSNLQEPNLRRYLDLVALGTIADMVPLSGVNRLLTWYGLEELRSARRVGVRALMEVSRVRPSRCSSGDVGFRLAPRINACGRLSDATVGVRLILSESIDEARILAGELDGANSSRQRIEAEVFEQAVAQVEALDPLPPALVLFDERWHPGVVGICASKLVERFDRPVILIGEGGRGSGRTARGVNLYEAIARAGEHLRKFGGHRAAAGLTIDADRVEAFRAKFLVEVAAELESTKDFSPELTYDDDLDPNEVDEACFAAISRLQPFGNGNPEPVFRMARARVRAARVVGKGHLKLRLDEGRGGGLEAIAFKRGDLESSMHPGSEIELAFHLDKGEFSGVEYLELRVKDLRVI